MKKIFFRVTNTSDNDAWKKARQTISHHVTPPTYDENPSNPAAFCEQLFAPRISHVLTL